MKIEVPIIDGLKIVLSKNEFGYAEVLDSMDSASWDDVVTYNLGYESGDLQQKLQSLGNADLRVITNVPSRFDRYFGYSERELRTKFRKKFRQYQRMLEKTESGNSIESFFNPSNHSKIIMTDTVGYVGSSNFSEASAGNFECGLIITDTEILTTLRIEVVDFLAQASAPSDLSPLQEAAMFIKGCRKELGMLVINLRDELVENNGDLITQDMLLDIVEHIDAIEGGLAGIEEYAEVEETAEHLRRAAELVDVGCLQKIRDVLESYDSKLSELANFSYDNFVTDYMNRDEVAREAYDENVDRYSSDANDAATDREDDLKQGALSEIKSAAKLAVQFIKSSEIALEQLGELGKTLWGFDNSRLN